MEAYIFVLTGGIIFGFMLGFLLSRPAAKESLNVFEENTASTIEINNKKRKFGAASWYYGIILDGKWALFTKNDIQQAHIRADKNPEDLPQV